VEERDGGGGSDTCWFLGSIRSKQLTLASGSWTVGAGNQWSPDSIGWSAPALIYYRNQGRVPCEFVWNQKMDIVCPAGKTEYKSHPIKGGITRLTVYSERDGEREEKNYW